MNSVIRSAIFSVIFAAAAFGPATATEVDFGSLSPSPGGCTLSGGDSGYVCASTQHPSRSPVTPSPQQDSTIPSLQGMEI